MISLNSTSTRIVTAIGESARAATIGSTVITILIEILIGGGMDFLWEMINTF